MPAQATRAGGQDAESLREEIKQLRTQLEQLQAGMPPIARISLVFKMNLLVSVEDEYMDRLSEVARSCEDAGMYVEQKYDNIGVLTGSVDSPEQVDLLRKVEGVSHVEESRQVQIAPPDSLVQ